MSIGSLGLQFGGHGVGSGGSFVPSDNANPINKKMVDNNTLSSVMVFGLNVNS